MDTITLSRNSCVKVTSKVGNSSGSGFFIADDLVVTCFHVIASIKQNGQQVNWNIFQDIQVTAINGGIINAKCISIPTEKDPSPLFQDFAILRLIKKPENLKNHILKLSDEDIKTIKVGSDCFFSGYPLATPAQTTNKGMVSGIEETGSLICIQGPINKGNSGGALISEDGKAIGIVSMREGGISKALQDLTIRIEATANQGSVQLMGVDPLQAIKATVETLNTYISTGIGYARNIKFVNEYVKNNQLL